MHIRPKFEPVWGMKRAKVVGWSLYLSFNEDKSFRGEPEH